MVSPVMYTTGAYNRYCIVGQNQALRNQCYFLNLGKAMWKIIITQINYMLSSFHLSEILLITLQGLPAAITLSGISLVTTELAPMTEFLPMVTPFHTIELTPINALS